MKPDRTIIFDLDGTLIDSSGSVLASLDFALSESGFTPIAPLEPSLIGPPLVEIIRRLTRLSEHDVLLKQIVATFKARYDLIDCTRVRPYPGIEAALGSLKRARCSLMIATHKRETPTLKIIEALQWEGWFDAVFCIDSHDRISRSKGELLRKLVDTMHLQPEEALYVGDRREDQMGAAELQMPFAYAGWGDQGGVDNSGWESAAGYLTQPGDLATLSGTP